MINATQIEGVAVTQLPIHEDDRGRVMKMVYPWLSIGGRKFTPDMVKEVYFSTCKLRIIKAWHCHSKMTLNYACIRGRVQVGLCDLRAGDTFGETAMVELSGSEEYKLLTIPPNVWNGYRVHPECTIESIICNAASEGYDESEISRVHPNVFPIPFDWGEYDLAG